MSQVPINFSEKFARFGERWSPRIVAQMNDYHFKLVKIQGEFIWHTHPETDEVFIVLDGEMTIHLRDGDVITTTIASPDGDLDLGTQRNTIIGKTP